MIKRDRKIYTIIIILVICLLGTLGGLLQNGYEKPLIKMVYVSKNDDESDFWSALVAGAKMAAKEYGVELAVLAPKRELDVAHQDELIDEALKMEPQVILLTPSDYKQTLPKAKEIKKMGIKLVLIDSLLSENVADSVVATDNVAAGAEIGKLASDLLREDGEIGIVSHVKGSSTAIEREKGVMEGLGDKCEKIVDIVYSDSDYSKAYEVTKNLLLSNPGINLVIGLNEYSAVGAARAIKDMGLAGKVNIIGFDNSVEEIRLLEAGVMDGIVIQRPFEMGYLGVESAVALIEGKAVDKTRDSGSKLIIKEEIFTAENQKLLFPFWGDKGK